MARWWERWLSPKESKRGMRPAPPLATFKTVSRAEDSTRFGTALADFVPGQEDYVGQFERYAVARAAESEHQLRADIAAAPDLFVQPRTVIFHGLKCGYEKGKLKLVCPDPDQACDLIRKHFPDLAETLIVTKLSPNKKALAELGPNLDTHRDQNAGVPEFILRA